MSLIKKYSSQKIERPSFQYPTGYSILEQWAEGLDFLQLKITNQIPYLTVP
jgi:hypothetical protein